MNESHPLLACINALLVGLPVIALLLVSTLRLDQLMAAPTAAVDRRRTACGVDAAGELIVCDPDGTRPEGRKYSKRAPLAAVRRSA